MRSVITLSSMLLISGCQLSMLDTPSAVSEQPAPEPQTESAYLSDRGEPLAGLPASAIRSVEQDGSVDPISSAAEILGEQLIGGLSEARVKRFPMTILPFGALPGHASYQSVGERVSESLLYALQANEYNLIDYRVAGMPDRAMPEVSEQQIGELRTRNRIYFVLIGNYAHYPNGLVVNARVLDTTTRQVLAAGQVHIADQLLEGSLPGYDPLLAAEKGMIVETGGMPAGVVQ
jgi:TolB-like protein